MQYKQLFIFRRDLRIEDNITLNQLLTFPEPVITIFIFDPKQISPNKNKYFSNNCVQFMCESLQDLAQSINEKNGKLAFFSGDPVKVIQNITQKYPIKRIGFNQDYTFYSKERDDKIKKFAQSQNIEVVSLDDITILPLGSIKTNSGTIYQKFTPFYNKAKKLAVPLPKTNKYNFFSIPSKNINLKQFYKTNPKLLLHGGRSNALNQIKLIPNNYPKTHDIPSIPTTLLSAYNKFGCISVRELMQHLKQHPAIARQLYFRDFYYNVYYYNPELFFKTSNPKYTHIVWNKPSNNLEKFFKGQTGYPIIDAGIRQMLTSGFMHNRVRMLVASFFSKDLLYNWKIGEKFFANNLYDYDPIQNNAGWQTVAGTGVSALEWFRVMNPWTQTIKFDPECTYIKTWVPELKDVPNKIILNWENEQPIDGYPRPIINHERARDIMLRTYRNALN